MKDTKLRNFLKLRDYIIEGGFKDNDYIFGVSKMEKLLRFSKSLKENYFKNCPCCENDEEYMIQSDSVEFKILTSRMYVNTRHTTKRGYEAHKPQIEKWEKEVVEYERSRKNE